MKNTCKHCKHTFPSSKALGQHIKSKHFRNYIGPYVALVVIVGIGIAVVVLMMSSFSAGPTVTPSDGNILERSLTSHDSLRQHFHSEIMISVDGKLIKVPANVGVSRSSFRYIHTHDDTGKIHIESPSEHIFTLSDFFTIWGKEFSDDCVDTNCGKIVISANGDVIDSPVDYILQDGDKILIEVSTT